MPVTFKSAGQVNRGATSAPALDKPAGLAASDTILVGLAHTGVATAGTPTAPFTLLAELVAADNSESSLHVYVGKSADWAGEAASFTFPLSASRGGCILEHVVAEGDVDLAAIISAFERETSATPSISATSTRDGAMAVAFASQDPPSGTTTGTAGGTGGTWTERADLSVASTSSLHTQTLEQASAGAVTAQPTLSQSASVAQAVVFLQPAAAGDVTPPTVVGRTPAAAATGVLVGSDVTATFSEPLDPASVSSATFSLAPTAGGAAVPASVTLSGGDTIATLNPTSALAYSTSYTATLSTGIEDVAGNNLAAPDSWSFTTEADPGEPPPEPTIIAAGPGAFDSAAWYLDVVLSTTGDVLGLLEAETVKIVDRLNGGLELTARVRADRAGGTDLGVSNRIIRAFHRPDPSSPRILRFAGHVSDPLVDHGDEHGLEWTELVAKSPWALLHERYLDTHGGQWSYAATDQGMIAADLIARAREYYPTPPYGTPSISEHGVTAQVLATVARDRSYEPGQPIAEAIMNLAEVEGGFDFLERPIDPWTFPVFSRLVFGDLRQSVEDVRLEYGRGTIGNIATYRLEQLAPVNSVIAHGAEGLSAQVFDEASIQAHPLRVRTISHPTVTRLTTLEAHAREALRPLPVDLITLGLAGPDPLTASLGRFPRYWVDFQVGSILRVIIRGARRSLDVQALVREATVEIDADGATRVTGLVLEVV